jgi:CheY-like chemotaxis protein
MKQVLIADDDVGVLRMMQRALPEYAVIVARNGPEALAVASRLERCDLLITDYLMPSMTGDELAGRMRRDRPDIKTLMVTCHSAVIGSSESGTDARLAKPFRCAELRHAVASLIGKA